ncbi:helix-turn-helix domain-containing protein [Micromonospora parva]|uniref:helix-turn-helix domain-containing protein n=1 Tax=Micromonospora parva TaxID=1464048 RepID=UPI003659676D
MQGRLPEAPPGVRIVPIDVLSEVVAAVRPSPDRTLLPGAVMPASAALFAEQLRALMRKRGVSYRTLATQTFYSKSYLHDLASGRKAPTTKTAQRLDAALKAGGELAVLVVEPGIGEPWAVSEGAQWSRRDAERLADLLTAQTPNPDNAAALAHQWLIADPPQRYELSAGRRVGASTVTRIESRIRQLRRLDDHVGGAETYALVAVELAATAELLRAGSYSEAVSHRLLHVVADLCQLAGFVAEDSGKITEARQHYLSGMRAAHAGGDAASAANCLSSLSYLEASTGDRRGAVTLARSAYVGGRHAAEATGQALLLERVAWAHARLGEVSFAERALGQVEEIYPRCDLDQAPSWAYWLTQDEVEVMAGRVWTELRRPLRAVPILESATARYGDDSPRETSLYLSWLAEALLQAGEFERVAVAAGRSLELARQAQSPRAVERVAELSRMVAAAAGETDAVAEFLELSADLSVVGGGHPGGQ